jgi:hypothetical protein
VINSNSDFGTDAIELGDTNMTWSAGGGVMVFFGSAVGLRGDVRYFRSLQDPPGGGVDLQLGKFDFWRGTGGVAFKF